MGGVAAAGHQYSHESEHDLAAMVSDFLENGSSGADSWCSSDKVSGFSDLLHLADKISVRVRIGSPIIGYEEESRNRSVRQRIPHKIWTDEDGVQHVKVSYHIRGPHGGGMIFCEMFKDKEDNQWKYTYLMADILRLSHKQLILESFLPAV